MESEALATLIINKLRAGIKVNFIQVDHQFFDFFFSPVFLNYGWLLNLMKVCAIKAPGFGENRKSNLQDLAILTGGQVGPFS